MSTAAETPPSSTAAPAPVAPPPAAAETAATAQFDSLHRPFDPQKFRREFDKVGRWKNLWGRNKPGSQSNSTPPDSAAQKPETPKPAAPTPGPAGAPDFSDVEEALKGSKPEFASIELENVTAETLIGVLQVALILIGDDEGILSDVEKKLLRRPLERVLDKYNIGDKALPPEAELALAVAGLVITRLQKPKTATWFAKVKAWFVNQFFRAKGRALAAEVRRETAPENPPSA